MAEDVAEAILRFLKSSREPALLEPGEEPYVLAEGSYAIDARPGRLTIQVWDNVRNLARRVSGIREERNGRMELAVLRFGGKEGSVTLFDRARPQPETEKRAARLVFREQFRRHLARQYPGWNIAELSMDPNLEESLSPAYARALLRRGTCAVAAAAAPPGTDDAAGALTFGLVWLDYLRRREPRLTVEGLAVFVPEDDANPLCLRISCLDPAAASYSVFVYSEHGYEERVDPADFGNLETVLPLSSTGALECEPEVEALLERLCEPAYVERRLRPNGDLSLCVRGLEFARASRSHLRFGLERKRKATAANVHEAANLARELARMRSAGAADRGSPIFRQRPEAWLESEVRQHMDQVDATLLPWPVYNQVPALAAGERGIMDLLAVDRSGRLAVLELKASEDIHLPLQALDYWLRVRWHCERGEFGARGYFPGIVLKREWPRLLLIAPALEFHPKTEVILRFLAPGIEVERIGLGVEWRQGPKVVFRLRGAERPA